MRKREATDFHDFTTRLEYSVELTDLGLALESMYFWIGILGNLHEIRLDGLLHVNL